MTPQEAIKRAEAKGIDFDASFDIICGDKFDALLELADAVGYCQPNANESSCRSFFAYLVSQREDREIEYERNWDWSGYKLILKPNGLWLYEQWSAIQGTTTGRKVLIEMPADLEIVDEADLDTVIGNTTKLGKLIEGGKEICCLNRGIMVE